MFQGQVQFLLGLEQWLLRVVLLLLFLILQQHLIQEPLLSLGPLTGLHELTHLEVKKFLLWTLVDLNEVLVMMRPCQL